MKRIFLSAGHSDTDPGAVAFGRTESAIVSEFRDLVAAYLEAAKIPYARDRRAGGSLNLPLKDAVKMIQAEDLAIEFHLNAASETATGVETLSAPKDYAFCTKLCEVIANRLHIRNRGAKPENSGQHSRLAFVQAGGIICELFFLTNKSDLALYDASKEKLASDIADLLAAEYQKCRG